MPGASDHRRRHVRPSRVVVIGASIGGLTAAETLRHEGFGGQIVLIGDERHRPYLRPPLSKQVLLGEWEPEQASILTGERLDELGIELRTSCAATGLDVTGRTVRTTQGDVAYDELFVATGSEPRRHPRLPTALTLRTLDDAVTLRDGLRSARRVGVIGAGILGSEVASAARAYGADALLVGRSATLTFGGAGPLLSSRLLGLHAGHGVELALRADVLGVEQGRGGTTIRFADGRTERVDLVVTMIGGTPRTRWLESSTLTVADGVVCDSVGRAAPGVSAVGDVAAWEDPVTGWPARVEHQSNAIEQAVAVATRIAHGGSGSPPVPLFWSEVHGVRIRAYGWFDPVRPLVAGTDEPDDVAPLLMSRDAAGRVRGVVGWDASPRAFRTARAAVLRGSAIQEDAPVLVGR